MKNKRFTIGIIFAIFSILIGTTAFAKSESNNLKTRGPYIVTFTFDGDWMGSYNLTHLSFYTSKGKLVRRFALPADFSQYPSPLLIEDNKTIIYVKDIEGGQELVRLDLVNEKTTELPFTRRKNTAPEEYNAYAITGFFSDKKQLMLVDDTGLLTIYDWKGNVIGTFEPPDDIYEPWWKANIMLFRKDGVIFIWYGTKSDSIPVDDEGHYNLISGRIEKINPKTNKREIILGKSTVFSMPEDGMLIAYEKASTGIATEQKLYVHDTRTSGKQQNVEQMPVITLDSSKEFLSTAIFSFNGSQLAIVPTTFYSNEVLRIDLYDTRRGTMKTVLNGNHPPLDFVDNKTIAVLRNGKTLSFLNLKTQKLTDIANNEMFIARIKKLPFD